MKSIDDIVISLGSKVSAAIEEFDMAIAFHEVWKPAAYDERLHRRLGSSYASQAFLITRTALRREMLLALIRLWDTSRKSVRMQSIADDLAKTSVIDEISKLRADRMKMSGALSQIRVDIQKQASSVVATIRKYTKGGSQEAILENLTKLRHENLAHRQLVRVPATGANITDEQVEGFYQDNLSLIRTLASVVNAAAYDPAEAAEVHRHYAEHFWARISSEQHVIEVDDAQRDTES